MRKIETKTVFLGVIVIAILFLVFMYYRTVSKPIAIDTERTIEVNKGDSFYGIINSLSKEKVIKGVPFIKLYVLKSGQTIEVKPGDYTLNSNLNLQELIDLFNSGSTQNLLKFTVPEGYTINDISEKLENEGVCSKEAFINAIENYKLPAYVKENNNKRYNLEGYLFPDTYSLSKNQDPTELITLMISRFGEALNQAVSETGVELKEEDIEKVVTIASMIEREAILDEERPIISSVIQNRINQDMMLQIDATVIYALGEHVETVLHSDLEVDSPYNTYRNYGLPIGPISNPGLSSIKAALKPEKTDYIFYVLESEEGSHYFTNNYEDFIDKQTQLGY